MNILNVNIIKHKKIRFEYLGFIGFEYTLPVFIDTSIDIGQVVIDMQRVFIVTIAGYLVKLQEAIFVLTNPLKES